MLRVNVGLSRKLSRDFNSTGYSVNLDGELTAPTSDPEAVIEQVKELFDLAEEALNQQIERAEGEAALASRDEQVPEHIGHRNTPGNGNHAGQPGRRNGHQQHAQQDPPATAKQISYLLSIGKRLGCSTAQLEAKCAEIIGEPTGLYELTKKSAGVVIDALTRQPENSAAGSTP